MHYSDQVRVQMLKYLPHKNVQINAALYLTEVYILCHVSSLLCDGRFSEKPELQVQLRLLHLYETKLNLLPSLVYLATL
jgi:hypothetical protein